MYVGAAKVNPLSQFYKLSTQQNELETQDLKTNKKTKILREKTGPKRIEQVNL